MATLRLSDLLEGVPGLRVQGNAHAAITEVRDDSRLVEPGDLFVAVAGTKEDGRRFIDTAIQKGAAAVLVEGEAPARNVTWVVAESARRALGKIAANRYQAASQLTLTAVTGTSGKTTLTYLMESILTAAGRRPGVVGTVTYRYPGKAQPAPLTTPGPLQLHAFFAEMRAAGCTDAVLEASSHALEQGRVHGCSFRVAGLTNVTLDHLDYHGTHEAYFAAKSILFRELLAPGNGTAVLFVDCEDGQADAVRGARARPDRGHHRHGERQRAGGRAGPGRAGTRATLATPSGPIEISVGAGGGLQSGEHDPGHRDGAGAGGVAGGDRPGHRGARPACRGGSSGCSTTPGCCAWWTTRTSRTRWSGPWRRCAR